jgi:hypothetical protein
MKRADYYKRALRLLQELKTEHPNYTIGQHIATALDDYTDIWSLTDKEFCFALEKYKAGLDIDIATDDDVQRIVADGMNLEKWIINGDSYREEDYE